MADPQRIVRAMPLCPSCGCDNYGDASACGVCGTKLGPPPKSSDYNAWPLKAAAEDVSKGGGQETKPAKRKHDDASGGGAGKSKQGGADATADGKKKKAGQRVCSLILVKYALWLITVPVAHACSVQAQLSLRCIRCRPHRM